MNKIAIDHPSKPQVFISYSHKDKKWLEELLEHLQPLKLRNLIACWSDKDIETGEIWSNEITNALQTSMIAVLLVSPAFLASDYITKNELLPLLNKSGKNNLKILWVPLSACNYKQTEIANYQSAYPPEKPLDTLSKPKRNQVYIKICEEIFRLSDNSEQFSNHIVLNQKTVTGKKEIEYKFAHDANMQFKFIATEQVDEIFEKLKTVCDLIDIGYHDQTKHNQEDYYYDDDNMTLKKCGASFRKRIRDNEFLVTIKQGSHTQYGMERFEHEFSCNELSFNQIVNDHKKVEELFLNNFNYNIKIGELKHLFTICNERNQMSLETKMARYLFCYDTFYYYYKKDGRYSEYFYEIEIELDSSASVAEDVQLQKLNNSLTILGFKENDKSKFEKGCSFEDNKENIKNFICVSIVIIDYSKRTPVSQLQTIQKLNHFLKDVINHTLGDNAAKDIIYLPFGSGMTLIFEENYNAIIPILLLSEKTLKSDNKVQAERGFEFKVGIHYGPVFKCSDLNENLNFGGSGINISQEIMNLGDSWHLFLSIDAHNILTINNNEFQKYFHEFHITEHISGIGKKLFNIYNKEEQIGNPERP